MAVTALSATILAMPPTTLACPPGGLFSVIVEIELATDAGGGSIDIYIYDEDLIPPDNLLDSKMNFPVQPKFFGTDPGCVPVEV